MAMWKLRHDKFNTFDRLRLWGKPAPENCILYNHSQESPVHLYFNCDFTREVWAKIQTGIGNPPSMAGHQLINNNGI